MPIGDLLAQISGQVQPALPSNGKAPKRKAEDDLSQSEKAARREPKVANFSRPISQAKQPESSVSKPKSGLPSSRVNNTIPPRPSSSNGATSGTTPRIDPSKPPKKGSYAEIMARGKAAQASLGPVGKISHKPIEKALSKRERQELKEQQSQRVSSGKTKTGSRAPLPDGRNSIRENNGKSSKPAESDPGLPDKKTKKAAMATTGYTGTARPNPALAKHARTGSAPRNGPSYRSNLQSNSSANRYTYASDEEDEEEDEDDYDSNASSDMEAAVFEVDEEEELAARIAREEDAEAMREENRLKREKEEKRRKLAAMAKSREKR